MSLSEMDSNGPDAESKLSLVLLIESDRNQELLADQLGDEFIIYTAADEPFAEPKFDLCLLDTASLRKYEEQLRESKTDAKPVFLPYLLLAGERSPDDFSERVWDVVDEVVQRPISKAELDARVENLLHRRRLSVQLDHKKERSDRRFESLFQSTPDPVVVVRPDGTITEANEAFARLFDVSPEDLENHHIGGLELSSSDVVERVLLRIAEEDPMSTTVEWKLDDGDSLVTELNTDVVTGLGEAAERIGIFRDVTERTEREKELQRQNERLKEFGNTIAHDLRNPLNVAQGRLDLAEETGDSEHFEAIRSSHERMEQMIEEILTLAKQGQAVLDPDDIALKAAVDQAWSHVKTRDATLVRDFDSPVVITADEGRLCELLENLFRNSIEHGGDSVTVRVGNISEPHGFFVEDDGLGIPPEKRSEVFEAGYTDASGGTGFGLSIVQQIVDGHDWTISITESESGGARFEITDVELS